MFYRSIKAFALLALMVSAGYADNRGDYNYPKRNLSSDCPSTSPASRCDDVLLDRVITPDAGPKVKGVINPYFTVDFIYWIAREEGLRYAYTGSTSSGGAVTLANAIPGSVKHVGSDVDPGFKVGLGSNLYHDGWDVFAQYTYLWSNPSRQRVELDMITDENAIKPLWDIAGTSLPNTNLVFASGNWNLRFNVIDLELGRNYYISKHLTLRPFAGLKGSWQEENYTVRYIQDEDNAFRMRNDQDYWSVGVRIGSDNAWYLGRNFSIYGNFALSALWSCYEISRKDFVTPFIGTPNITFLERHIIHDLSSIKPVLEVALGLRYDIWFYNDDYHCGLSAGWEEQIWFSQNQRLRYFEESAHGDLVLQGLTVKARFDF